MKKHHFLLFIFFFGIVTSIYSQSLNFFEVKTENKPLERAENAFVMAGNKMYLIGGRGVKPVEIYDPATNSWSKGSLPPVEMHHFQAAEYKGLIYVMGAFTGNWPWETPLTHIYIYDPLQDLWILGPEIPVSRRRGSAGVTVYNDKIYMVGGIVNGHSSGWVAWFDEYDPLTNSWKELPEAPRSRDHIQIAVVDNKLVVAAGRRSGWEGKGLEATTAETDLYDFASGKWSTLPSPAGDIPTQRGGGTVVVIGNELWLMGGESKSQVPAHSEIESLNVNTGTWKNIGMFKTGRHATQVIRFDTRLYVAAGCGNRGGAPELNSLESLILHSSIPVNSHIIYPGKARLNENTLNFGKVKKNSSKTITVELTHNEGSQSIPLTYITITGNSGFSIVNAADLPVILLPGQTLKLQIKFEPLNGDSAEANLNIKRADKGKTEPWVVKLAGN